MDDSLRILVRRRWCLPVVAELQRRHGAKFVTLCHHLDGNQAAVRQSLDVLLEAGIVARNEGYGHPLRPEYVLTPHGHALGPACVRLDDLLTRRGLAEPMLRRWSLPVVGAIGSHGRLGFAALGAALVDVTDRALSMTLRELQGCDVIARRIVDDAPMRVEYALRRPGAAIAAAMGALGSG